MSSFIRLKGRTRIFFITYHLRTRRLYCDGYGMGILHTYFAAATSQPLHNDQFIITYVRYDIPGKLLSITLHLAFIHWRPMAPFTNMV